MSELSTWWDANYKWLLDGVGGALAVAIIVGIVRWLFLRNRRDPTISVNTSNQALSASGAGSTNVLLKDSQQVFTQHNYHADVHNHIQQPGADRMSATEQREPPISTVTPWEILQEMEHAPPLSAHSVSERYLGLRVRWHVIYGDARTHYDGKATIFTRAKPTEKHDSYAGVTFEVIPDQHVRLKSLKKDAEFTVEGEIYDVGATRIDLTDVKITY